MKKSIIVLCCFFSVCIYAQKPSSERGKIGITFTSFGKSDIIYYGESDSYYKNDYCYSLGINYIYPLNSWLKAETGIEYSTHHVKLFAYPDGITRLYDESNLSIISVPLMLRADFLRYFFANAGTFVDFDIVNDITDSQTGMGFALGLGVKYDFKCGISLFANPFLRLHSLIHFVPNRHQKRLLDDGVRFGITYDLNKIQFKRKD